MARKGGDRRRITAEHKNYNYKRKRFNEKLLYRYPAGRI